MVARHRVIRSWVGGALLALAVLGCKKPPPPPPEENRPPPDRLAKEESPEGPDKAFALPLPRASRVAMRFPQSVHVTSTLKPEALSNFVRARVKSGRVLVGATTTTFEDVVVPREPKRHITIEIRPGQGDDRSIMVVRDVTPPPPADPNETDADRMKKAGLTPEGKPLDPKHME